MKMLMLLFLANIENTIAVVVVSVCSTSRWHSDFFPTTTTSTLIVGVAFTVDAAAVVVIFNTFEDCTILIVTYSNCCHCFFVTAVALVAASIASGAAIFQPTNSTQSTCRSQIKSCSRATGWTWPEGMFSDD